MCYINIYIYMDCGNLVYSTDDEVVPPGLVKISACTLEGVDFNTSEDILESPPAGLEGTLGFMGFGGQIGE